MGHHTTDADRCDTTRFRRRLQVIQHATAFYDDPQTTIFGVRYPCPVILAPIGLQAIFSENAEFNPARAANALGLPFILSSSTTRTPEEVAKANGDGHRWLQLYRLVAATLLRRNFMKTTSGHVRTKSPCPFSLVQRPANIQFLF
jgi:isopentenyl diphosphate isomerase/L-lactate dehydrogenase-like FMN-dependent dehydrogenase